jgi:PAS domain S-box-containing protein
LGPTEIDAGIQHALETIGQFAGADRSYIFQFSEDQARLDNTYEWCAPGIESQTQRMQGQSTGIAPWTIERIKRLEAVKVPRVADLPAEARLDQVEFQAQSIQSLICIPMVYRGEAIGSSGFDAVQRERDWSEDDAALLQVVGEIIVNSLEHKRAQAIEEGQRKFLELLATGGGFSDILHALVGLIEEQWPGMLGLILLLDEDGLHLHIGASASLPKEYVDSIEGLEIGPQVGSCGTACYTKQRVIVEDIATDPRWESLRDLGLQYGLRACWSEPVFSESGQVVGTFAIYYHQPRTPSKAELRMIETAAHLVGVAVEHERAEQALQQTELRFRGVFEGAPIGVSITSLDGRLVETNRALQQMFGYSEEELRNLSVFDYTYPEDVAEDTRLFYEELVPGKRDHYQLEKRYIRKNGQVFWGRLSLSLARGPQGEPLFAIATTEDITAAKEAAEQLAQAYQSLEQRVNERTRELAAVNAIAAVVSRSLDLNEILGAALDKTLEVTGMELGIAYRLEPPEPGAPGVVNLVQLTQRGLSDRFISYSSPLALEGSIVEQAAAAGYPVVWQPGAYPNPVIRQAIEEEGVRLGISIPLSAKDRLVGALIVGTRQTRPVAPEELAMLAAIGQQVALAIDNARLYDQAQQTTLLEERGRLARELHDSVTQSLYSVTLYAEAAARLLDAGDTQTAIEHLRELRDTSKEALREMRMLIYELRPPVLRTADLAGALQARLDAVEARAGLETSLEVDGTDRLSYAVQEELYHIAREALNNLLKHARARSVHIHLSFQQALTLLEICDDGIGFTPEVIQTSGGLGIFGMQERAQRIGAQLEILSAPGKGTKVRVLAAESH